MLKRLSNVIFSKSEYFVESKKDDGVTAVNTEFNFSKASIWFRALRDGDVIVELDPCSGPLRGAPRAGLGYVASMREQGPLAGRWRTAAEVDG